MIPSKIAANALSAALITLCVLPFRLSATDYAAGLPQIPGEYVDVGTHRLHHRCEGEGSPTIVIDNGIAGSATEWYTVQENLAHRFRICVYDRAGYAWSEPGPAPRTTEQIADELKRLLEVRGEAPPYIFVGHSFGGFTALRMTSLFPEQAIGVVLVDSSSPDIFFEHEVPRRDLVNPIAAGAATGTDKVPSTSQEMARFLNSRRKALFVQMDEIANFKVSATQVPTAETIRVLPMLIIARDAQTESNSTLLSQNRETQWRHAQEKLSQMSSKGRLKIASGCDHFIHLCNPKWLAREIEVFIDELVSKGI